MIIVSDITTLQNRGKYQGKTGMDYLIIAHSLMHRIGILGALIALANRVGPFLGGAIIETLTWRWVFWIITIITFPAATVIWFFLRLNHRSGQYAVKMAKIDYCGILLNLASTLLLLIPISGDGVTYAWKSAIFISTISIGSFLGILFVVYEWKVARLPIMPLRLFGAPHCWALYIQSFLTGFAYFGNFFYLPIYFQYILRHSALVSGALILAVVIPSSVTSILAGQYMSLVGNYMHCILAGFMLWTIGNGLTLVFGKDTSLGKIIGVLIVEGAGIGFTLQPTLVSMYANSHNEDRAVTTGLRNFIRTLGGAFSLVISGEILSNILNSELLASGILPQSVISQLTSLIYTLNSLDLGPGIRSQVLTAYTQGIHYIFFFFTCCSGLSLLLTVFVGNTSLRASKPVNETEEDQVKDEAGNEPDRV